MLSLASYRVTRLVVKDTIWEKSRERFKDWLIARDPPSLWRDKLYELLSCPFCVSVWASAGVMGVAWAFTSIPLPLLMFGATCGGSLVAWEYIEDDELTVKADDK